MIEILAVAFVFAITEIFKFLFGQIEQHKGKQLSKEQKSNIILLFAFILSLIYSALITTNIIDQSTINMAIQIFAGAIATYEVLYKKILVKIIKQINSK